MKTMLKRTLVLFLAALMAFTSLPMALAEDAPDVTDESEYNVESTNSLGKILTEALEENQASPDEHYYISDISFSGNTATVQLHNQEACDIVIAAYDEADMRMLSSDAKTIEANTFSVELTLADLSAEDMIVKAFLLDDDHNPLSRPFTFNEFSKEYKEFMTYTINDFEEEKVVNLDDSEENNFFVLNDEVHTVAQSGTKNVLVSTDFDNEVYTFSNADKNLTELKQGDIFYYDQGDVEELIITRVVKVTAGKDGSVVIEGEPLDLEEAFACVKIEDTLDNGDFYQVEEEAEASEKKNAARNAPVDVGGDLDPIQFAFEYSKDKDEDKDEDKEGWSFSGKVRVGFVMNISAHIKLYWSAFYKEVEVKVNPEIDFEFSAEGAAHFKKKLPEIKARTIVGVNLGFSPVFEFDISGEISVKIPGIGFTLGFRWDSKEFKNLCSWETPKWDELKIKVKVFVGIDLNPNVDFINRKVATAGVVGPIGLELSGELSLFHNDDRVKHDCKVCVDGSLDFKILNLSFEVVLFEGKKGWIIKEKKKSLPIVDVSIHILDFYWSQTHGEVGLGECPHKFVKVDFLVKDADGGAAVKDAEINSGVTDDLAIKYNGGSATVKTNKDGKATYYYPLGTYKATVKATDYAVRETDEIKVEYVQPSDTYYVNNSSKQVTIECKLNISHIQFGTYPQSRVTDAETIAKLDATSKTWASYEYYSGTGNTFVGQMTPGDFMQFADFKVDGVKYRAVKISEYRPYNTGLTRTASDTLQDENGYTPGTYYFKYEPLNWRVLDVSTGYVMCEYGIDAQAYQNTIYRNGEFYQGVGSTVYANDYAASSIRDWLNYDFYETAFTEAQKTNIKTTALNNDRPYDARYNSADTNDKIFLLSYAEAINPAYGFDSSYWVDDAARRAEPTDYAKSQGAHEYSNGCCWWWLRSPGDYSLRAEGVDLNGGVERYGNYVNTSSSAVRPACHLSNLKSDISQSDNLFSQRKNNGAKPAPRKNDSATQGAAALGRISARFATPAAQTATRADAVKGEEYVLLVVKDADAENLLAADNLLYIDQQTAESETVTFTYVPREEYPDAVAKIYGPVKNAGAEYVRGDVDGNGKVESADARLALRASVKLENYEPGSAQFLAADVDGNGKIESSDARTILRVSVKLESFT